MNSEIHLCLPALQKESSELGNVNDEECQSYSDPCPSGYLASCCYTVPNIVSAMIQFQRGRSDLTIVLLLLQPVWIKLKEGC